MLGGLASLTEIQLANQRLDRRNASGAHRKTPQSEPEQEFEAAVDRLLADTTAISLSEPRLSGTTRGSERLIRSSPYARAEY